MHTFKQTDRHKPSPYSYWHIDTLSKILYYCHQQNYQQKDQRYDTIFLHKQYFGLRTTLLFSLFFFFGYNLLQICSFVSRTALSEINEWNAKQYIVTMEHCLLSMIIIMIGVMMTTDWISSNCILGWVFHSSTSDEPLNDGRRYARHVDRHRGRTTDRQGQRFQQLRIINVWRSLFIPRITISHWPRPTHCLTKPQSSTVKHQIFLFSARK